MHDEGKWPLSALLLRGRSTLARRVAERRRPGQRQHIEIELPGPVLPEILRERQSGGQHHGKDDGKRRTNEKQRTRPGHAISPHSTGRTKSVGLARGQEHYKNKMAIKGARN